MCFWYNICILHIKFNTPRLFHVKKNVMSVKWYELLEKFPLFWGSCGLKIKEATERTERSPLQFSGLVGKMFDRMQQLGYATATCQ